MAERKKSLSREEIVAGLSKLDVFLEEMGIRGELCLYGGACMCLAFSARNSTKDVDAVFQPAAPLRKAAFEVANEMGWDWNWLNDDVKGFLSRVGPEGTVVMGSLELSHLKVYHAKADYLLAMKCLAARTGGAPEENASPDLADAIWLCRELEISDRETIVKVILRYFPDRAAPERTEFFIEEIVERLNNKSG